MKRIHQSKISNTTSILIITIVFSCSNLIIFKQTAISHDGHLDEVKEVSQKKTKTKIETTIDKTQTRSSFDNEQINKDEQKMNSNMSNSSSSSSIIQRKLPTPSPRFFWITSFPLIPRPSELVFVLLLITPCFLYSIKKN